MRSEMPTPDPAILAEHGGLFSGLLASTTDHGSCDFLCVSRNTPLYSRYIAAIWPLEHDLPTLW